MASHSSVSRHKAGGFLLYETGTPEVGLAAPGWANQYTIIKDMVLGLGYSFLWMDDLDMDIESGPLSGQLAGTYEDTSIHFFALNLRISF